MQHIVKKAVNLVLVIAVVSIVALIAIVIYISMKEPSLSRSWAEDSQILPDLTLSTSSISVKNVRDWRYAEGEVLSRDYYDETYDLDAIEGAYLAFNPFGKWEGVGHAFFVFEFSDGKSVAVSVEARREYGETYSAVVGAFNEFELWYAFGSPADFFTRRAIYHNEDLYLYPLSISTSSARALFVDMAETAEKLETEPRFYNTLTTNCTNVLADAANRVKEGSVPFHISRLFTGFADDQLYDLGFIRNDMPFEEVYKQARIDEDIRERWNKGDAFSKEEFWWEYQTKR